MKALAVGLVFAVCFWLIGGPILAFMGYMARQGLAKGSTPAVEELTLRQERQAGKVASTMFRRLWPVPVIALIGFILIAANYRI